MLRCADKKEDLEQIRSQLIAEDVNRVENRVLASFFEEIAKPQQSIRFLR
jgi:hypothetical protein